MSKISSWFKRKKNKKDSKVSEQAFINESDIPKKFFSSLKKNEKQLQEIFKETFDFQIDSIKIGNTDASICYLTTMLNKKALNDKILSPLHQNKYITLFANMESIRDTYFPTVAYEYAASFDKIVWHVLTGYAVIMVDGINKALSIEVGQTENRSIIEPSTQTIIRGPKDGFIEDIQTNISLIRRRIKNPHLKFENYYIGRDSHTTVAVGYMDNITNSDILNEVRSRIKKIDTSGIFDSGHIEDSIKDKTLTPFPLLINSERPDAVAGYILDGKVAILVDGSPFALAVPSVLTDFFQSTEDYYNPFFMAIFIRIIRYASFLLALILPSLYVSLSTFHQELLPTQLLISIQSQRVGVPFPAVIEILIMEFTFELLREAGIRMPRAVGQTVSIVGALVIGQAAVEAGLVSNLLVIIVALTAIASFISPIYNFSISSRLLRFALILFAAVLGLYGVLLGLIVMVIHIVSLRSFGVPYLAPIAPFILEDQGDAFIRVPIWGDTKRPSYLYTKSPVKSEKAQNPSPPMNKNKGGKK